MPWYGFLPLILTAALALAGLAVVALAFFQVSSRSWRIHTGLVLLLAFAQCSITAYWSYDVPMPISWWSLSLGFLSLWVVPSLVAGQVARTASRQWPARRWLTGAVTTLVLLVAVVAGNRVGSVLAPDIVSAYK